MLINYRYTEKIALKQRKPVRIGNRQFESIASAARYLGKSVSCVKDMIKQKRPLESGELIELVPKTSQKEPVHSQKL